MDNTQSIDLNLPKEKVYFVKTPVFKRILSFIVDLLIFDFTIGPIKRFAEGYGNLSGASGFSGLSMSSSFFANPSYLTLASITIIIGFLFFIYNFVLQYYLGQTLGMMMFNIRLVNVGAIERAKRTGHGASMNRDLKKNDDFNLDTKSKISKKQYISAVPTAAQIFLRNIIFLPIIPFVVLWIVEPIYMLIKKERLLDSWIMIGVVEEFSM